jgi:threonine/homoserine/homoserine lactone efflux protein
VQLFLRGLVIGFSIAAPVGPIGVLCIRRTLADGRAAGFVPGLGAATADAVYGGVAAFGLTVISSVLIGQSLWLRLGGGVFLCHLGVKTFLAEPAAEAAPARGAGLLGAYASTLVLTLTNPTTILSFVAIFAGFGAAAGVDGWTRASSLVAGVFLGSAVWWLLLSGGVGLVQHRLDPPALRWINRGAGIVIAAFGVLALLSALPRG